MALRSRSRALVLADLALGVDFALRADLPTGRDVAPLVRGPGARGEADEAHSDAPRPRLVERSSKTPPRTAVPSPPSPAPFVGRDAAADGASSEERLEALRTEHERSCPHCTRATYHTRVVFGEGNPCARLLFVGEAPGEREDQLGRPFVGRAGQKLDEMIAAMGMKRADVYIANVLKSRPPENRTPLPDEVALCGPTLLQQIAIINPRVIVTLGAPATKFLLKSESGISRLRGIWARFALPEELGAMEFDLMPTFHPAYLLRNYTPETRKAVWSDLQQVVAKLALADSASI